MAEQDRVQSSLRVWVATLARALEIDPSEAETIELGVRARPPTG